MSMSPDVSQYPAHGPMAERLAFATRYAVLAPSSHNSQPWHFSVHDNRIDLKADRTRRLPVVDPEDRELAISCGAALFQLQVALRWLGLSPEVELAPDCYDPDVLAIVRVAEGHARTPLDEQLFAAIPRRHTDRSPFSDREPPRALVHELVGAAREHDAWLDVVSGLTKEAVAALIAEGDRRQLRDPEFRKELSSWLRANTSERPDGMPGYTRGWSELASHVVPLVVRTFDVGGGHAARDHELAVGSPLLAVLGTENDSEPDWVNAGQALAHVLLLATAAGVSASFLNQAVEVPELRERLHEVIAKSGRPQLILRLGYGTHDAVETPRRPIDDVVIRVA